MAQDPVIAGLIERLEALPGPVGMFRQACAK